MKIELSGDDKWLIAVIIAIGIAVGAISVVVLQFSRVAVDMRNHEYRINASNSEVIQQTQRLVDGMRDDYRDRMYGVEEVLRELRQIRGRLQDGDESRETPTRDIERALSDVTEALTVLTLFRPVRTSAWLAAWKEIRVELRAIREHLDGMEESENGVGAGSGDDGGDGSGATP